MKLIFSLLFLVFSVNYLFSENSVGIRDTLINRAIVNKIPIYGEIDESLDARYDFCFQFNSLVIDIKDIIVDGTTIFSNVSYDITFNNFTNSELKVKSTGLKNNNYGILFYALIEGLAGSDTLTKIEPKCFVINDVNSDNINYNLGTINVRSTPVDVQFKEGLGLNSPNPFYDETKIPFTIDKITKVSFKIYSLNGRKVLNSSFADAGFGYTILNSKGLIIEDPENYTFEKGIYKLILKADNWKVSAGAYYLIMTTANSNHKINLMLIK